MKNTISRRVLPGLGKRISPIRLTARGILRLFVAGSTGRSREAILRARQLCAAEPTGTCRLEVIDIYQQPRLAREYQILATPTLIKEIPRPARRFIGSLLDAAGELVELNLGARSRITP